MTNESAGEATPLGGEIAQEEWAEWCDRASAANKGRTLSLVFLDDALGEIRLTDGMPFIAVDFDQLGSAIAFSIRYGDGVVPMRYMIAEPRHLSEEVDASGALVRVTIEDSTRRKTFVGLG